MHVSTWLVTLASVFQGPSAGILNKNNILYLIEQGEFVFIFKRYNYDERPMPKKNLCQYVLYWILSLFSLPVAAQYPVPQVVGQPSLTERWLSLKPRSCGTDVMLTNWRQTPAFRQKEKHTNHAILMNTNMLAAADYTLPVVFHIVNEDPASITDQQITDALAALNDAYGKTGAFAGARSDTRIQFCLAKTDPNGGATTGILRTKSYLGDFDADMEGEDLIALGKWDGSRYINIWLVSGIKSEFLQTFECGAWTRLHMAGYAGAGGDVVVSGLGVDLVAHEMGHYLSLIHTFAAQDCKNDDCTTDGDMVCDTPPDKSINGGFPCSNPENSCSTDTLSGFTTDVPDLPDNFMDYGGGTGCIMSFTEGQAQRMRDFIGSALPGMIGSTLCNPPCASTAVAAFTKDADYPLVGSTVNFTNTSTGATGYEWLVDGVVSSTGANFSLAVPLKRTYVVTLRAYDAGGCFSGLQDILQVNCGVTARYYPDKRKIASRQGIQTDSVVFTNRSVNANAWSWRIKLGATETEVATTEHLTYEFLTPGTYQVRLIATNGSCADTTNYITIVVDDPTADGAVYLSSVECYDQTKLRIQLYFYNFGYQAIPKNTEVSFYNGNNVSLGTYLLPYDLKGKCASYLETYILDAGGQATDSLYAVFNDPQTVTESNYNNNKALLSGYTFRIQLAPADIAMTPAQTIDLTPAVVTGGAITSVLWTPASYLNCDNCTTTTFTAPYRSDTLYRQSVKVMTTNNCFDTAGMTIHIPPVDDYTANVLRTECGRNDSMYVSFEICNGYTPGNIPKDLVLRFYDATGTLIGNDYIIPGYSAAACATYGVMLKGTSPFNITVVPDLWPETDTTNNSVVGTYILPTGAILPADTLVMRGSVYTLRSTTQHFTPLSYAWTAEAANKLSCTTCATPGMTVKDSAGIDLVMTNQYGCLLPVKGMVRLIPPDFTMDIKEVKCYDNTHTMVTFEICTGNGYDSIPRDITVTFYDGSAQLKPIFIYPNALADTCHTYTHIVATPGSGELSAVVNAVQTLKESDYSNNDGVATILPFTVAFEPDTVITERGMDVKLAPVYTGETPVSYTWAPVDGLSCSDCTAPIAHAVTATDYRLAIKNEYFCTDTAYLYLRTHVKDLFAMPNAFSPNGDGVNDIFYIISAKDISVIQDFLIFDRWGNMVFERHNGAPNDKTFGWDGSGAKTGVYVYFINAGKATMKGTVLLIK
jgi:gliding motility-associated-like protein